MREADPLGERDRKGWLSLLDAWTASSHAQQQPRLLIAESSEVNAASLGSGLFVFSDSIADLPDFAIDGIAAHEVAHDRLRHAKKAGELQDLTDFLSRILGFVGGATRESQDVLTGWVELAALPKYSKAQESAADREAVQLLARLGYENPESTMADTLRLLLKRYGDQGGGFFESHPSTRERIADLTGETPTLEDSGDH